MSHLYVSDPHEVRRGWSPSPRARTQTPSSFPWTVLEDELDILVELCRDLIGFHPTLVSLDFRLTCSVWRVYLHLTSSHHARLADRLQLGAAVELLYGEIVF